MKNFTPPGRLVNSYRLKGEFEKESTSYEVYKVEDNKIKKVAVTIGATIQGRTEVTSGLTQDDLVVLTIPPGLTDGKDVVVEKFTGTW